MLYNNTAFRGPKTVGAALRHVVNQHLGVTRFEDGEPIELDNYVNEMDTRYNHRAFLLAMPRRTYREWAASWQRDEIIAVGVQDREFEPVGGASEPYYTALFTVTERMINEMSDAIDGSEYLSDVFTGDSPAASSHYRTPIEDGMFVRLTVEEAPIRHYRVFRGGDAVTQCVVFSRPGDIQFTDEFAREIESAVRHGLPAEKAGKPFRLPVYRDLPTVLSAPSEHATGLLYFCTAGESAIEEKPVAYLVYKRGKIKFEGAEQESHDAAPTVNDSSTTPSAIQGGTSNDSPTTMRRDVNDDATTRDAVDRLAETIAQLDARLSAMESAIGPMKVTRRGQLTVITETGVHRIDTNYEEASYA